MGHRTGGDDGDMHPAAPDRAAFRPARAAHDGVVDDDQTLAFDVLAQRVELEADAELAQRLRG